MGDALNETGEAERLVRWHFRAAFDEAIIGFDPWQSRLIYDEWLCVRTIMRTQYLDEEDAIEHAAANVFTMTTLPAGPIFSTLVRRRYN